MLPGSNRALTGLDLELRLMNVACEPSEAEELVLRIKSSKTDQLGFGAVRNQYATKRALCPVAAFRDYAAVFPPSAPAATIVSSR